jgi:RND superfamily putative drug exporter
MGLAGERAWYAPTFLTRVHDRLGITEAGPATEPATAPVAVPVTAASPRN